MFSFYRILLTLFGGFEFVTNLFYLFRHDGVILAYRQHRELPAYVSHRRMRIKIVTMLLVGLMFLLAAGWAWYAGTQAVNGIRVSLTLYALLTLGEAVAHRRHNLAWALAVLVTVLALLSWLLL